MAPKRSPRSLSSGVNAVGTAFAASLTTRAGRDEAEVCGYLLMRGMRSNAVTLRVTDAAGSARDVVIDRWE